MPVRSYPLSVLNLGDQPLGSDAFSDGAATTQLSQQILSADRDRQSWLNRQIALTKLRFGIRPPKDFPWPGCSNLNIPVIDGQIRRMKPLFMKLLVTPDPVVEFVGEDPEAIESERLAEAEMNWLFKTHMNAIEPMAFVIDSMLHRGYGVVQVGWDYRYEYECRVLEVASMFPEGPPQSPNEVITAIATEYDLDLNEPRNAKMLLTAASRILAGEPFVKLAFKSVSCDRPALWDRDPVQIVVPSRTTDYGDAEWICVQHLLSDRRLKQMEADGFFIAGSVSRILDQRAKNQKHSGAQDSQSLKLWQDLEDQREKIYGVENEDQNLVWEVYHWRTNSDGLMERTVTYIHPRSNTRLSTRPFAMPFKKWPFVRFAFDLTSRRFHSPRGVTAMLESLNREINALHNGRVDGMTIRNSPAYQSPVLAGFKARNFRVIPGQILEVPLGGTITPIGHDRGAYGETVNEENMLQRLAEGYIGTFDNTLTNGQDNRTATEVNAAVQLAASTSSLDTILFQMSMKEVFQLIWELWLEFRPTEVSYKVLNAKDPTTNEPQLVSVRKAEINKRFKLYPTGTIANTNHALELSKAREAMQIFAADTSGLINRYELYRYYISLLDTRVARRVLNPPEAAAEQQAIMQAAAALQQDPNLMASMGLPVESGLQPDAPTEILSEPS